MKKMICGWIKHNLAERQNAQRVRIYKETLELLNDVGDVFISKIITGVETYILFFTFEHAKKVKDGSLKMISTQKS